jgi:hypothetical protein
MTTPSDTPSLEHLESLLQESEAKDLAALRQLWQPAALEQVQMVVESGLVEDDFQWCRFRERRGVLVTL